MYYRIIFANKVNNLHTKWALIVAHSLPSPLCVSTRDEK